MSEKKIWMTAEGYQKLQEQLNELQTVKRPAIVKDLHEVSGGADWRESAQVTLMQAELDRVDAEIHKLSTMLARSEVVEPRESDTIVDIGETVVLQTNGHVETYTLVGPAESAPEQGRISYESPVGHALLNHKVGDEITVHVPAGVLHYRIIAVQ